MTNDNHDGEESLGETTVDEHFDSAVKDPLPLNTPRTFEGVAIEQYDRAAEIELTLTQDNSFLLVQPMTTENGGVRFHVLTDASVPDMLDVLGKVHNIVSEGWAEQQQQIAIRDGNAESYFRTRSASCMHTPGGGGEEIDSCHRCWVEAGSPHLPPIDGDHDPVHAPEIEGGGEVIEGAFGAGHPTVCDAGDLWALHDAPCCSGCNYGLAPTEEDDLL